MDRALYSAPYTARITFYSGSTPTDPSPDTATIEVVRSDGTVLVTAGQAVVNDTASGAGVFSYTFTPTQLTLLDVLELRWTATVGGQSTKLRSYVEVVGGFLCTLADLKLDFATSTDAQLALIRTAAEQRLEDACRRAFVPRFKKETRTSRSRFRLSWSPVRALRFAEVNGANITSGQLAQLNVTPAGLVVGLPRSNTTFSLIRVGYEHGMDFPSEVIREAVLLTAQETFSVELDDALVVRREADNQSITYASPTSSGPFQNPTLRRIVRDHAAPLVV